VARKSRRVDMDEFDVEGALMFGIMEQHVGHFLDLQPRECGIVLYCHSCQTEVYCWCTPEGVAVDFVDTQVHD
jgi:hypothetical protein